MLEAYTRNSDSISNGELKKIMIAAGYENRRLAWEWENDDVIAFATKVFYINEHLHYDESRLSLGEFEREVTHLTLYKLNPNGVLGFWQRIPVHVLPSPEELKEYLKKQ